MIDWLNNGLPDCNKCKGGWVDVTLTAEELKEELGL